MVSKYQETRKALETLLAWCVMGKRYESRNPYLFPEISDAMKLLAKHDRINDWLDVKLPTEKYYE